MSKKMQRIVIDSYIENRVADNVELQKTEDYDEETPELNFEH